MRVLIFTCGRDWEKAKLATRTIPADWSVAWVVDATDSRLTPPAGVDMLVRPFERGVNLSGPAAVLGICGVIEEQAEIFGRVGKVDSDTLLVDPAFMLAGDVAGMAHGCHPLAAYGMAYALSSKAAGAAAEAIKRAAGLGCVLGGEDVAITTAAQSCGGVDGRVRAGAFWESKHRGEACPPGRLAIHCGGVRYAPRHGDAVAREMARLGDAGGLWRR